MEVNKTTQAEAVRNFYRKQGAERLVIEINKVLNQRHAALLLNDNHPEARELKVIQELIDVIKEQK